MCTKRKPNAFETCQIYCVAMSKYVFPKQAKCVVHQRVSVCFPNPQNRIYSPNSANMGRNKD